MNAREKTIQEKAYAAKLQKLNTKEFQARSNQHLVVKLKRNHKGKLSSESLNSSTSASQFSTQELESQPDYDIYDKFLPKIVSYKPVGVSLLSVNMCKQQDPWAKLIHNKLFSEENKEETVRHNQKLAEAEYSRILALQIEEKKRLQQQAYRHSDDVMIKPLLADTTDRNPKEIRAMETQIAEFAMHVTEEKRLLREASKARDRELAKQMEKEAIRSAELKSERDKKNRAERTKYAEELLQRQKEAAEKRRKEKEKTYDYDRKCLEEMDAKMKNDEERRAGESLSRKRSIQTTPVLSMEKFQQPVKEREKFINTLINSECSLNGLYAHAEDNNASLSLSRSPSRHRNSTAPPTSQWDEMKLDKIRKKEQEAKKIEEERIFLQTKMIEKLAEDRARVLSKKETAKNYQKCLDKQRQEMNFISLRSLKDGMSTEERQLNSKLLQLGVK